MLVTYEQGGPPLASGEHRIPTNRIVTASLLGWLATISVDLLLHGGLLARFYVADDPFLLQPMEAFRLIPLGYLSFLMNVVLLVWLMVRLDLRGAGPGVWFGAKIGLLIWGAWTLALASITTARYDMLVAWFIGQTVEMSVAAAVIGAAFARRRVRSVALRVVLLLLACIVITIILQSIGWAPAQRVGTG